MFYPFISFSSNGITQTITLPDAARILFNYDSDLLGLFIDISIIILPMSLLIILIPLHLGALNTAASSCKKTIKIHFNARALDHVRNISDWCFG